MRKPSLQWMVVVCWMAFAHATRGAEEENRNQELPTYSQEELERLEKFREGNGVIVLPGKEFPGQWIYRPPGRRDILWYALYSRGDEVMAILPELRPGMLLPLADEPLITGLRLDSDVVSNPYGPTRTEFGEDVLRDLPKADHLKYLYLNQVDLTSPETLRHLRDMDRLEWLEINYCGAGLKEIFDSVGPLPALEELRISPGGATMMGKEAEKRVDAISPEDIKAFAQRVPNLKVLAIEEGIDTPMTAEVVMAFSHFKNLRELSIPFVAGRDYRKVTDAHSVYYFKVVDPLKKALPGLKTKMSSLALDLSGTGLPSLDADK